MKEKSSQKEQQDYGLGFVECLVWLRNYYSSD